MKLLAIDGNSLINRAFYGIKTLSTKSGIPTNGIYGFMNILNKLREDVSPDAIAVAFDLRDKTFRHKMYEAYKGTRKGMPEDLVPQLPLLKELLGHLGITTLEQSGYEADDILGTLAQICCNTGHTCYIATGDRDALQLVTDCVTVMLSTTKMGRPDLTKYTPEKVVEKYSLPPKSLIDIKALMGDSSDNIPGVAGVGEKTATQLILKYHNIENIYEQIDSLDASAGVIAKLKKDKEMAFLSKKLGTVYCEVPINGEISSYTVQPVDIEKASLLLSKLEFYKILEQLKLTAVKVIDETPAENINIEIVNTNKNDLLNQLNKSQEIDLFYNETQLAICINKCIYAINAEVPETLDKIIYNKKIGIRAVNAKSIYKLNSNCQNIVFDSQLAAYLVDASSTDYDEETLITKFLGCNITVNSEDEWLNKCAKLTIVNDNLMDLLVSNNLFKLFNEIELPTAKVLADMETTGMAVNKEAIDQFGGYLQIRIDNLKGEIGDYIGTEVNINSPKQLGDAIFDDLGLGVKNKKTKSGSYKTDADTLEAFREQHPVIQLILEYRQLVKLKTTYCDGLVTAAQDDGRIYTTYNQTEARTGRISSTNPNLHAIPVRTELGRELRRFFIAKSGYVLLNADYSQIELRILAHIANDKTMIKAFFDDIDIHTLTASQVFTVPIEQVTKDMRSAAKAVNFGIVYGISAFSLAQDIGVTVADAKRYIEAYFATYSGVKQYMDTTIELAKSNGYVETIFGRKRYLPELASKNGNIRAFGERVARNTPIQGAAADIIKIAMCAVHSRLNEEKLNAKIVLQVHDELIIESSAADSARAAEILEQEMECAADLRVPLVAEVHSGENWLSAKA